MVEATTRRQHVADGVARLAAERQLTVVDDPGLLDEVAGLVEWPVPLLGRIDPAFMDLPPEVMQVSMRVNQRYFALRHPDGTPAPVFAFAANIEAPDGGATIVAGNERVLRARFSDARHFWDADRKLRLEDRVRALDAVTFHAKLGTQRKRVERIEELAEAIAPSVSADPVLAGRAARLAKADLTTGMVGEFPELQGVMGRYYALHDGENPAVADAIRDHYAPRGPVDGVPTNPVSVTVALADRIDLLCSLHSAGVRATGSTDPFGIRRSSLAIVRLIIENSIQLSLLHAIDRAGSKLTLVVQPLEILELITGRLRSYLLSDGLRQDVVQAIMARHTGDNLLLMYSSVRGLANYLSNDFDGQKLRILFRRAFNILNIEEKRDGIGFAADVSESLFEHPTEGELFEAVRAANRFVDAHLEAGDYLAVPMDLAQLERPLSAFFDAVIINDPNPALRQNRLRLLNRVCGLMNSFADFSRIEG